MEPVAGLLRREITHAAVDDVYLRVPLQILNLLLKLPRFDQVIGVQKLYVLARGVAEAVVLSGGLPGVLLPQKLEARVSFHEARDLFGSIVRRTVVHNDAFPVRVGLRAQALKRLPYEAPVVISRNDDAD